MTRRPRIVEVLTRDGLQTMVHETDWTAPTTEQKVAFIERAAAAGVPEIEITGFVHPRVIPQLADADEVARRTAAITGVTLRALVPNLRGAERAAEAGVRKLSCLITASEAYQTRNSNMSIADNVRQIERIVALGQREGCEVIVGMGICFLCPYQGTVALPDLMQLIDAFTEMGISEISIADSVGQANPEEVKRRVNAILTRHPDLKLGLHLHDMTGMALANAYAGWKEGVEVFESCTGGYGGGIAMPVTVLGMGNIPTEDLVNLFHSIDADTGINLSAIRDVGQWFSEVIGVPTRSRVSQNGTYDDLLTVGQQASGSTGRL